MHTLHPEELETHGSGYRHKYNEQLGKLLLEHHNVMISETFQTCDSIYGCSV